MKFRLFQKSDCPCLDDLERHIRKYVKENKHVEIPTCDIQDVYNWIDKVRKKHGKK
jgi:hypothetical protein